MPFDPKRYLRARGRAAASTGLIFDQALGKPAVCACAALPPSLQPRRPRLELRTHQFQPARASRSSNNFWLSITRLTSASEKPLARPSAVAVARTLRSASSHSGSNCASRSFDRDQPVIDHLVDRGDRSSYTAL